MTERLGIRLATILAVLTDHNLPIPITSEVSRVPGRIPRNTTRTANEDSLNDLYVKEVFDEQQIKESLDTLGILYQGSASKMISMENNRRKPLIHRTIKYFTDPEVYLVLKETSKIVLLRSFAGFGTFTQQANDILGKHQKLYLALLKSRISASYLKFLPTNYSENQQIILTYLRENVFRQTLEHVSTSLKKDKDFIKKAIVIGPYNLIYADSLLRGDKEVISVALDQIGSIEDHQVDSRCYDILKYLDPSLMREHSFIMEVMEHSKGYFYRFLDETWKKDLQITLAAASFNKYNLDYCPLTLRNNKEFALEILNRWGSVSKIGAELLNDDSFLDEHPEWRTMILYERVEREAWMSYIEPEYHSESDSDSESESDLSQMDEIQYADHEEYAGELLRASMAPQSKYHQFFTDFCSLLSSNDNIATEYDKTLNKIKSILINGKEHFNFTNSDLEIVQDSNRTELCLWMKQKQKERCESCINRRDFYEENIEDVSFMFLWFTKTEKTKLSDGVVYCFDIIQLVQQLRIKNLNPYTGNPFTEEQLSEISKRYASIYELMKAVVE